MTRISHEVLLVVKLAVDYKKAASKLFRAFALYTPQLGNFQSNSNPNMKHFFYSFPVVLVGFLNTALPISCARFVHICFSLGICFCLRIKIYPRKI